MDFAINPCITNEDSEVLKTIDSKTIVDKSYYDNFNHTFKNMGAKIIIKKEIIEEKSLQTTDKNAIDLSPYDLSHLKAENIDYVVVIHPFSFGITREYHGFIPISAPNAFTHFQIYMVDVKTNALLGYIDVNDCKKQRVKGFAGHDSNEIKNAVIKKLENDLSDAHQFLTSY